MDKLLSPVRSEQVDVIIQLRGSSFSLYGAVKHDALVADSSTHILKVWIEALRSSASVQLLYPGWGETRYSSLDHHMPECDAIVMMYDSSSNEETSGDYRKHILSQYIDTGKLLYSIGEGATQIIGIEIVRDTAALEEIGFRVGECTEAVARDILQIILADIVEKLHRVRAMMVPPEMHDCAAPDGCCRLM
jgi:hypothetical protein